MDDPDATAIENLRAYIKIPSVTTTTDYEECVKFLTCLACSAQLEVQVVRVKENRPFVIMKFPGKVSCLPSIALNSHMDVVPVEADKWDYPPFDAYMDEKGRIYGRGTQDMKMVGIQYVEAIRRLKCECGEFLRTIVILFTPDEEMGGHEGMKLFVETPEFKALNIGLWLDESIPSSCPGGFIVFYGEKHRWCVKYHIKGDTGHSSLNLPSTAAEKLGKLLNLIYEFRNSQLERAKGKPGSIDYITLNVTVIEALNMGKMDTVIPPEYVVTLDARLPPDVDIDRWKSTLNEWCSQCGDDVTIEEYICEKLDKLTPIDDSNKFYAAFTETIKEMGYDVSPRICVGVTDARYIRNKDIPAFGFSSLNGLPTLMNGHNENIDKDQFLLGIKIYQQLLPKWGNIC